MPTYQYVCTQCGHNFEAVQAFTDDTLSECPECGGPVRKKFGAVGVVFKGSGFYRTDSRSGSTSTDLAKPQKQIESGNSGSAATSSESKSSSDSKISSSDSTSAKPSTSSAPSNSPSKGTDSSSS